MPRFSIDPYSRVARLLSCQRMHRLFDVTFWPALYPDEVCPYDEGIIAYPTRTVLKESLLIGDLRSANTAAEYAREIADSLLGRSHPSILESELRSLRVVARAARRARKGCHHDAPG